MTAVNIIRQLEAVHVLTDGGTVWASGKPTPALTTKTLPLPHINAAVSVSGIIIQGPILFNACASGATSFDHLRSNIVDIVREAGRYAQISFNQPQPFKIFVAGWSETHGPASFQLFSHAVADTKAWVPYDLPNYSFLPAIEPDALYAALADIRADADLDPRRHGWAILNAQRALPAIELPGGVAVPGRVAVSGFGMLTTIKPDCITQEIIGRWPSRAPQ